MKDALSYQVEQLLKENNLSIDFNELVFQIKSHPTYPSLNAITGVLDHFNIENLALDVPITAETLNQLPDTFLAQIEIDLEKQFVIVLQVKDQYKLIFNSKNRKTISQSEFLEQFTGILLVVAPNESHVKTTISNTTSIAKKSLAIGSVILFGLLCIFSNPSLEILLFLTLSVFGIYITISILKQEQGENTMLGDLFCSKPTENKNCNAVLTSKGSMLSIGLKLSDLSFVYFTGLGLATFILAISNSSISVPKSISILALPITFYSIYYQYIVLKKWCTLCLSIAVIMWLQVTLSTVYFSPNYELKSILITALSFTSVSLFWIIESRVHKAYKSLKQTKIEFFRFKRNFELFKIQLNQSKIIDTKIDCIKEIVFGNPNSNLDITIITNPMCGPCKQVHDVLEQILKNYETSAKLTIRFNINTENQNSTTVTITSRLLEIYHLNGAALCLEAMHDIYNNYSPTKWLEKWNKCSNPDHFIKILQSEYAWCDGKGINFTPEILINGQSFPKLYNRSDILFFIEDLAEISDTKNHNISLNKTEDV